MVLSFGLGHGLDETVDEPVVLFGIRDEEMASVLI